MSITQITAETILHQIEITRRDYEAWQAVLARLREQWKEACAGEAAAKARLVELGAEQPELSYTEQVTQWQAEIEAEELARGAM